jgi:hypothetical protein
MSRLQAKRMGAGWIQRLVALVMLCAVASVGQPASVFLHGWQEHGGCRDVGAERDGHDSFAGSGGEASGTSHDASSCPVCRSASQSKYSLVVASGGELAPLAPRRHTHASPAAAPVEHRSSTGAPRAPPLPA